METTTHSNSNPSTWTFAVLALGPFASLWAAVALSGSAYLHESLLPWALLGVMLLWCPLVPASIPSIALSDWFDKSCGEVRGMTRVLGVPMAMFRGPAGLLVAVSCVSWLAVGCVAVALVR